MYNSSFKLVCGLYGQKKLHFCLLSSYNKVRHIRIFKVVTLKIIVLKKALLVVFCGLLKEDRDLSIIGRSFMQKFEPMEKLT